NQPIANDAASAFNADQKPQKTMSELFGIEPFKQDLNGGGDRSVSARAKAKSHAQANAQASGASGASGADGAAATGGADTPMSLGALLAMVGAILVKAIETTMS